MALEMSNGTGISQPTVGEILAYLVGAQLGAVTFVQDYLQLHFDGPRLNVYGDISVTANGATCSAWGPGFRDRLCGQIAKSVASVSSVAEKSVLFEFADGSQIEVSLEPHPGLPEAVYFHDELRKVWFAI
jgi:hypothetical protein